MRDWWKPENRYHALALAGAVTFILLVTFLHGCTTHRCEMVLTPDGANIRYVCY